MVEVSSLTRGGKSLLSHDDTHLNNNVVIFSHQQRRKRLENAQDFFCQDQDQDQDLYLKTKTETCVFVLEAPRDQDLGLKNYITGETMFFGIYSYKCENLAEDCKHFECS